MSRYLACQLHQLPRSVEGCPLAEAPVVRGAAAPGEIYVFDDGHGHGVAELCSLRLRKGKNEPSRQPNAAGIFCSGPPIREEGLLLEDYNANVGAIVLRGHGRVLGNGPPSSVSVHGRLPRHRPTFKCTNPESTSVARPVLRSLLQPTTFIPAPACRCVKVSLPVYVRGLRPCRSGWPGRAQHWTSFSHSNELVSAGATQAIHSCCVRSYRLDVKAVSGHARREVGHLAQYLHKRFFEGVQSRAFPRAGRRCSTGPETSADKKPCNIIAHVLVQQTPDQAHE